MTSLVCLILLVVGCNALNPLPTRRSFLQLAGGLGPAVATAAIAENQEVVFSGTASLAPGAILPDGTDAALYITIKKGAAPQEVVGLVKGAPAPPLGALRVPMKEIEKFPFSFTFSRLNLFPEFADLSLDGLALTVSARLDSDGVAATRGASDLVASTFINSIQDKPNLELKGRGSVVSSIMSK